MGWRNRLRLAPRSVSEAATERRVLTSNWNGLIFNFKIRFSFVGKRDGRAVGRVSPLRRSRQCLNPEMMVALGRLIGLKMKTCQWTQGKFRK